MLTEPLLDPGPDEPRSVTDERGALTRGGAIVTVDTLCRLRGMIDEDKVEHRLRYAPDIAALLESRPDDDPVLVEFVQTMNELYRLGMACEEVEPSATDAELAAITATHQRHLDQALRLHVCPPELRARIPELVAEGERIIPAVREWSSQAKALFWEIEQAQYAPHIPPNVRMSGFETGGYRALENVLMYLAGVVYEAWDQGDSGDMPDIDGVAAARYDMLEGVTDIDRAWSEVRHLRERVAELERSNDLRENALEGIRSLVDMSDDLLTEAAAERPEPASDEQRREQPWPADTDVSSSEPRQPHLQRVSPS